MSLQFLWETFPLEQSLTTKTLHNQYSLSLLIKDFSEVISSFARVARNSEVCDFPGDPPLSWLPDAAASLWLERWTSVATQYVLAARLTLEMVLVNVGIPRWQVIGVCVFPIQSDFMPEDSPISGCGALNEEEEAEEKEYD